MKRTHAIALVAALAAESVLFLVSAHRHYAWSFPRWFDQVQYLQEAYNGYEVARHDGFLRGAWSALTTVSPQGALHGLLALPLFELAGPSRTAALSLNLLAFIVWQAATFLAVRRVSGSYPIAWAAIALLAALRHPWYGEAASAVDFRLDWMAVCAFGTALAVAMAGSGFRSTRWSVLLGGAVGATILLRFLTAVYFGLIFTVLLVWLLLGRERRNRCGRLLLSAAVAVAIFAPTFWRDRSVIYSYYWVGHFTGPERALRDTHLGALASTEWILSQLLFVQVGLAAVLLGLGVAAGFLALRAAGGPRGAPAVAAHEGAWVTALAFLAAPAVVLAAHPEKASAPASILIAGAVWVVFLVWIRAARPLGRGAVAAVCACAVALGGLLFVGAETRRSDFDERAADWRGVNALSDYVYFRSEEAGLARPRLAVNWILEGVKAEALQVLGYERHGRMLPIIETLPTGLFATTRETAMKALSESDFVCLVTRAGAAWPFDVQMAGLLPEMTSWCDANLRHVGRLDTADFSVSIYERPGLKAMEGRGAVDFSAMVEEASLRPAYAQARVPSAPLLPPSPLALGSTRAEFRYTLQAAYSPIRYRAASLPEGLRMDPETGEIRGRFPRAGAFTAEVFATNPAGTTSGNLRIRVEDASSFAYVDGPQNCSAGIPVDVGFGAYDGGGNLDFIDVTDLTAGRTLDRIAAPRDQKQSWVGSYALTLAQPGPHTVLMRFVSYDASRRDPYYFTDRSFVIAATLQ